MGSTVPDITVDLEINQDASAAINGNVVNRFGSLTSGTGLNVSGNITARDEIAVADDLIATGDITASGAITAGGDLTANIVTIEGEKAVLAVGVLSGQPIYEQMARDGLRWLEGWQLVS